MLLGRQPLSGLTYECDVFILSTLTQTQTHTQMQVAQASRVEAACANWILRSVVKTSRDALILDTGM
jgi:hypothetical protein